MSREALCDACPALTYRHGSGKVGPKFRVDEETGCWIWVAGKDTGGYGRVHSAGRLRPAHRVAYEAVHGAVPDGIQMDHLCSNPPCVNPAHLQAVSRTTNVRRGAHVKLSREIVLEMRALRAAGATYAALGARFGVSDRAASFACRGRKVWYKEMEVAA